MIIKQSIGLLLFGGLFFVTSCKKDTDPYVATFDDTPYTLEYSTTSLPAVNLPTDNPLTVEKVKLGKMLFYENRLSKDGSMNCASCHVQGDGFSDLNQFSTGVEGLEGGRQAMAIFNMAWNENGFFWDGRAELLRHQSILPIQDPLEMNEELGNVIAKLSTDSEYTLQFTRAFEDASINALNISLALEAFMMSIVSDNSKYDRYLAGLETLTPSEEAGRVLFFGEYNEFFPATSGADCAHCHSGGNFENDQYMNNGLDVDGSIADIGREKVTNDPADKGKFKVVSLRNIAVTGPYMHDGRFTTLEEVIDHYNDGIQISASLDPALQATTSTGLMLDATEKADLINFLKTLTDDSYLSNPDYKSPF